MIDDVYNNLVREEMKDKYELEQRVLELEEFVRLVKSTTSNKTLIWNAERLLK